MSLESNREDWEFSFTIAKVLEGARGQLEFRQGRVKHWTAHQDKIMEEVKEKGLSIHIPEAMKLSSMQMSNYSTRSRNGAQIMVDPTLQENLNEAWSKIQHHSEKVQEYEGWVQFLQAGKQDDTLKLTHHDWMYFFGKLP